MRPNGCWAVVMSAHHGSSLVLLQLWSATVHLETKNILTKTGHEQANNHSLGLSINNLMLYFAFKLDIHCQPPLHNSRPELSHACLFFSSESTIDYPQWPFLRDGASGVQVGICKMTSDQARPLNKLPKWSAVSSAVGDVQGLDAAGF